MGEIRILILCARIVICLITMIVGAVVASAGDLTPNPSMHRTGRGMHLVVEGVGLAKTDATDNLVQTVVPRPLIRSDAILTIDVPGPVQHAMLYWGGQGAFSGKSTVQFGGSDVVGTLIGAETMQSIPGVTSTTTDLVQGDSSVVPAGTSDDDPTAPQAIAAGVAYLFGADVTSIVADAYDTPGTMQFSIADTAPVGSSTKIAGATLVIVYQDEHDAQSYRLLGWHGCDFAYADTLPQSTGYTTPVTFQFDALDNDRLAELTIVCGNAQAAREDRIMISDNDPIANALDASDGPSWDTDQFDIAIPAGVSQTTVTCVSVPNTDASADTLSWSLALLHAPCNGTVGDRIWQDVNGNGVQDPTEPGLGGISMQLYRVTNAGQIIFVEKTTTDQNGEFLFSGLCAGDYRIIVNKGMPINGFVETTANVGVDDTIDNDCTDAVMTVTLDTDGSEDRSVDCGLQPFGLGGACCLPDGNCAIADAESCLLLGGTPQPTGTDCVTGQCPAGACCIADGTCIDDVPSPACDSLGGEWQGLGADCATANCPQPIGACCLPDGMCINADFESCVSAAGIFNANAICSGVACPQPGACCLPDGTCRIEPTTSPDGCISTGGVYQGDDTSCTTAGCPAGACCFVDGSCDDQSQPECTANGGTWQGVQSTCSSVNCDAFAIGACCLDDGNCVENLSVTCVSLGGSWSGAGSTCSTLGCGTTPERGTASQKGSLLFFSKVEVRWSADGNLAQDTFIQLTNDYPDDVDVHMYFVNGDAPADAIVGDFGEVIERAHPGWNWVDNGITLTADQSVYWSVLSGSPAGVSPFTTLDPGLPPGRPVDPANPFGARVLRGYIIAFAVNDFGQQIKWNHLAGEATLVHYDKHHAWSYTTWASAVADDQRSHGAVAGTPGVLELDGQTYQVAPDILQMMFDASAAYDDYSIDTALTLHPVSADLRQETDGPITTKASFEVWNENELKLSGADRCVTCWDNVLLSAFDPPNHFILGNLQTTVGKARIQGLKSQLCDVDFDPNNNADFPFPPDAGDPLDPRDVVSEKAALLGVRVKLLAFGDDEPRWAAAGGTLIGMGYEPARIEYDVTSLPPSSPTTPDRDRFLPTPIDAAFDDLYRSLVGDRPARR